MIGSHSERESDFGCRSEARNHRCGSIEGVRDWRPSVCRHCGRDLPVARPSQNSGIDLLNSGEMAKVEVQQLDPPPQRDDIFDGCISEVGLKPSLR